MRKWVLGFGLLWAMACKQPVEVDENTYSGEVELQWQGVAGGEQIRPGQTYRNGLNEPYQVQQFKFYVSDIRFERPDSGRREPAIGETYFLVNALESTGQTIRTRTLSRHYTVISFLLGVDSALNVSGAQTGALDPSNGMFWTWNSGYIMAKLEGTSTASPQVNGKIEYHIGGFSGPNKVQKRIVLTLPGTLRVENGKKAIVRIQADANRWFQQPYTLSIELNPVCTTPGLLAKQFADNYADMFTAVEVLNP